MVQIRVTVKALRSALGGQGLVTEASDPRDPRNQGLKQSKWKGVRPSKEALPSAQGVGSTKKPTKAEEEDIDIDDLDPEDEEQRKQIIATKTKSEQNLDDISSLNSREREKKKEEFVDKQDNELDPAYRELKKRFAGRDLDKLTAAESAEFIELLSKVKSPEERQIVSKPPKPEKPASAIKTGGKAFKQPPASRPVTKDYVGPTKAAPYITSKSGQSTSEKGPGQGKPDVPETEIPFEQLEQMSPKAYAQMPKGSWGGIVMKGGYMILKPNDPHQKSLIWASVPPRGQQPAKPHAWRTSEELTAKQKESMGFEDERARGMAKKDAGAESERPFGSPLDQPKGDLKGVRFKGGAEGRVDIDTTGTIGGAASGPGGIPTAQASAQAASVRLDIPDWDTLDLKTLERASEMASRRFQSMHSGEDSTVISDIESALSARQAGVPPAKPIKFQLSRRMQRKDVRDVVRAFEKKDYETAKAYLNSLSHELRIGLLKLLNASFDPDDVAKLTSG